MTVAAIVGAARVFLFEEPFVPTSTFLIGLVITVPFGLLVAPCAVVMMAWTACAIWKPNELQRPSWQSEFFKRFRADDVLHVIHVVGWAAVIHTLVILGAHYVLYESLAVIALFQLPAGLGVLLGVRVSVVAFAKYRRPAP